MSTSRQKDVTEVILGGPAEESRPCAICGRPVVAQFRPFCSKRCADVDLSRWLGEKYRIETEDTAEEDPSLRDY